MTLEHLPEYLALGAAGAAAVEMLKVYELRGKLAAKRYSALIRAPIFWAVVGGMLLASGFVAWAVNAEASATVWQVVLSGMGARALLRGTAEGRVANRGVQLGNDPNRVSLSDAFM